MKTLILLAALAATPLVAQAPAQPVCVKAEIVPGFEAWGGAPTPTLAVGKPALIKLPAATSVNFSPALTRPATAGSFGGVIPLTIAKEGTYRIALSAGAWIDVILDGEKQKSVAHTHGPACSGITKIVDFTLKPGAYQIQLSEVKAGEIRVMVIGG